MSIFDLMTPTFRHAKWKNLSFQRFGSLTPVICAQSERGRETTWTCQCNCGRLKTVKASRLRNGVKLSCGCVPINQTHGQSSTKLYGIWSTMKSRCSSTWPERKHYFDRGIRVCDRWRDSFEAFAQDMGPRPSPIHSIDRIDGDGNYEPGNCRWATPKEQAINRKNTRYFEVGGKSVLVSDLARQYGINRRTLLDRIDRGWDAARVLAVPAKKSKPR